MRLYRQPVDAGFFTVTRAGLLRIVAAVAHDGGRIRIFNASWKCWGFCVYFGEKPAKTDGSSAGAAR